MAQFARPASDSATGSWSSTPLWSKIDEGSPGDNTTISSADNTSPDNADFTLSSVTDPTSSSSHIIRVQWNKDSSGGHTINAVAELYQGDPAASGTLIATLTTNGIGSTPQTDTYTLSGTEADNITDYSNLYLRISRQGDTGGSPSGRRSLVVDFAELEVPSAVTFNPELNAFRFYDDDAGEASSTPLDAENTDVTIDVSGGDQSFQIRTRIDETNNASGDTTDDWRIEYSHNSGAWTIPGAGDSFGNPIYMYSDDANSGLTDTADTTNRSTDGISDPGQGSFVAGEQYATSATLQDRQITAGDFTEHVWAINIDETNVSDGDTLDFRVVLNGVSPITANVTPRVTIGSGGTEVAANTEALTLTTQQAGVGLDVEVQAATEGLTLTTQPASVGLNVDIAASVEALSLTTFAATVTLDVDVQASTESLSLTPQPASIGYDVEVQANVEALSLATQPATIDLGINVLAATEALTLTSFAASIGYDVDVQAATDALSLAPQQATVSLDVDIAAGVESLSLATNAASIALDVDIQAATEALTLTTLPASLGADTNVAANTETLSLTTQPVTVTYDVDVPANTDALSLTALQGTVSLDVEVAANAEALSLTTLAANVANDVNVQATTEALTVTTFPAALGEDANIAANVEALSLAAFPASIDFEEVAAERRTRGGGYRRDDWEQVERADEERRKRRDEAEERIETLYERIIEGKTPRGEEPKAPQTKPQRKRVAKAVRALARQEPALRQTDLSLARLERLVAEFARGVERDRALMREEEEIAAVLLLAA